MITTQMMTKITFRISFIVTNFALVLIFYDFMRSFKMMIEIIFNVKRPVTFGAFKFRSFKICCCRYVGLEVFQGQKKHFVTVLSCKRRCMRNSDSKRKVFPKFPRSHIFSSVPPTLFRLWDCKCFLVAQNIALVLSHLFK